MEKIKGKFKNWEEYVKFARECDQDPLFKRLLDKFMKITS